jgi:hypothetical protein
MRVVRWAAAAATIVMSLMDLPFAVDPGSSNPTPLLAWAISLLGVLGIVAAIALLRRASWGRPAVLVIGAINFAAAVVALIIGSEGAVIGLVVSGLIVVLGLLTPRSARAEQVSSPVTFSPDGQDSRS